MDSSVGNVPVECTGQACGWLRMKLIWPQHCCDFVSFNVGLAEMQQKRRNRSGAVRRSWESNKMTDLDKTAAECKLIFRI